jgi:hypothetical protein
MSQGSFRDCRTRTARDVGPAPSRDLAPVEQALAAACDTFARYHSDEDEALRQHDADLYERSRREETRAEAALAHLRQVAVTYRPGATYTALPTKSGTTHVSRVEPILSRVASDVAGQTVTVRCWSVRDWPRVEQEAHAGEKVYVDNSGFAWFLEQATDLSPDVCDALTRLRYEHQRVPDLRLAFAVGVLAHEASHLVPPGEEVEWKAECYGMQRLQRTARLLGATHDEAARLADMYWRHIYPDDAPGYTSRDCRDGGLLDLHPASSAWP